MKTPTAAMRAVCTLEALFSMIATSRIMLERKRKRSWKKDRVFVRYNVSGGIPLCQSFILPHPLHRNH